MADAGTFKFGFAVGGAADDGPSSSHDAEDDHTYNRQESADEVPRARAEEVHLGMLSRDALIELASESLPITEEFSLLKGRVTGEQAAGLLGDTAAAGSDLIPGVYEGGFKLWECSIDLCKYLITKFGLEKTLSSTESCQQLQGKNVLELGCGHGLPGVVAMLGGATTHFQDYNREVLESLTMPAVFANLRRLPAGRSRPSSRFFAGDWGHMGELLTGQGMGGHYDIILASETLYNVDSQVRLLECIKQLLQPPHGVVYVASKSFYFGVGGGTQSFLKLVKSDGIFECRTVYQDGDSGEGSVRREVLEMKFPESIMPYFL